MWKSWKSSSQQNLKATNTHHEQTVWLKNSSELPIEIQCEFCIFMVQKNYSLTKIR